MNDYHNPHLSVCRQNVSLQIDAEAYLDAKIRPVFVDVPVEGRFQCDRFGQEEGIAGFSTETETCFVRSVGIACQVDIGPQEYAYGVEVITSAYSQPVDVCAFGPVGFGIDQ